MKTIYILLISLFISVTPSSASDPSANYIGTPEIKSTSDELTAFYTQIIACQAGFKIVAHYMDIYNTLTKLIDKNEVSSKSKTITLKLRNNWTELETVVAPIKAELIKLGIPAQSIELQYYSQAQLGILMDGLKKKPSVSIPALVEFIIGCVNAKDAATKFLKSPDLPVDNTEDNYDYD